MKRLRLEVEVETETIAGEACFERDEAKMDEMGREECLDVETTDGGESWE